MLGGRERELRIVPERAWLVLAGGCIRVARFQGEACRIFRESIVVLLEPVDLEKVVVPTG